MAGRGAPPKPPSELRRRNLAPDLTIVEADGRTHGPELPESVDWPDATVAWWETWRKSAQAQTFTDTDWSFLLDTAILHMEFWDGDRALAAELRLRAAKFGATPEDRARLKMSIGDPSKAKAATRTPQVDRRSRLLKAVGDGEA
jgi:hypothetical protein